MVNSDIHVYTDASKTQNDTVDVGIYIRDVVSNKTKDFSYRLNNSMSIFSAELTAINPRAGNGIFATFTGNGGGVNYLQRLY
jgi:hypothetical protein